MDFNCLFAIMACLFPKVNNSKGTNYNSYHMYVIKHCKALNFSAGNSHNYYMWFY